MRQTINAIANIITRRGTPVIPRLDVERIIHDVHQAESSEGQSVVARPPGQVIGRIQRALVAARFLELDLDFPRTLWRVTAIPDRNAEEVCCIADPWVYVSHLSAMQHWDMTNRQPNALHLCRPALSVWLDASREHPIGEGSRRPATPRHRTGFPKAARGRTLRLREPNYFGRSVTIPDTFTRLATIGQTFRDMLYEPELCSGIRHVLNIWDAHADIYLEEIIEALDASEPRTSKIAFVRAGYILTDRLGIRALVSSPGACTPAGVVRANSTRNSRSPACFPKNGCCR